MKYLIALLGLMFIVMVGISATLIILNTSLNWGQQSLNRDLAECNQEVIICNNLETVKENLEKAIEYQENLEPIDIYSEEERKEFYDILTTEEAFVEPKERKVCIREEYYFDNTVCLEWVVIVD